MPGSSSGSKDSLSKAACSGNGRKVSGDTRSKMACSGAVGGSSSTSGDRLAPHRHRWANDALYYSDDEVADSADNSSGEEVGGADHATSSRRKNLESSAKPFTKTIGATSSVNNGRAMSRTHPVASTKGSGSARFMFNPLGQMEAPGPALLPEDLEEGVVDEDSGCPVVDKWLVDDLRPPKKRVAEMAEQERGDKVTAKRPRPVVVSSSESDSEEDFEQWRRKKRREIGRTSEHRQYPSSEQDWSTTTSHVRPPVPVSRHDRPSHLDPPSSSSSHAPPLRVKVQIESHSYRIPCPARIGNKDTPISWLVAQASDRYFSQRGKRPMLELTTMDGASLFDTDPISHVLSQGEEVMGVVKDWVCPPLAERYHIACKVAGVGKLPFPFTEYGVTVSMLSTEASYQVLGLMKLLRLFCRFQYLHWTL